MQHVSKLRAALLCAVLAGPAVALEAHQVEAIDKLAASPPPGRPPAAVMASHYAVLLWVEDYCNGRSNGDVRNYLIQKGEKDREAFEAGWIETLDMLGKTDAKAMCALALSQYGPEGAQIRDAWRPR